MLGAREAQVAPEVLKKADIKKNFIHLFKYLFECLLYFQHGT